MQTFLKNSVTVQEGDYTEGCHRETTLKEVKSSVAATGETAHIPLLSGFFTSCSFMGEWHWECQMISRLQKVCGRPAGGRFFRNLMRPKLSFFAHLNKCPAFHIIRNTTSTQWIMEVDAFLQQGLEGLLG